MARYVGPVCKVCRRESVKLFLKGEKCFTKCILEKRPIPPGGLKSRNARRKISAYGLRMHEKQKLKAMSGMLEAQMRRYYDAALRLPGSTGTNLLRLLETRLDTVVRKIGWATSPKFARQLVNHGNVLVNGLIVRAPSYGVSPGDRIELKGHMKENFHINLSHQGHERRGSVLPAWLSVNGQDGSVQVLRHPEPGEFTYPIIEQYVVEFYSR